MNTSISGLITFSTDKFGMYILQGPAISGLDDTSNSELVTFSADKYGMYILQGPAMSGLN